ncbi:hypothetical protein [Xenorhabdus sp. PB62.4]|uniref:hypothetical protein n=1 Tax=Xenorhabdus sp. PB62.4 TaxID=1851573 RepID=UPI00165719BA|nr:hypothetical protein [Xenorhabdus sp. PB62.4]
MSISPFELFEKKHDIAVYGGAGAGKTTTLQMYVRKLLSENSSKVIYIPLNRFINRVKIILNDDHNGYDILISREHDYEAVQRYLPLLALIQQPPTLNRSHY